jgi:hypothetical protein
MTHSTLRRFVSVSAGMFGIALGFTMLLSTPSSAQPSATASGSAPDSSKALVGTWEGSYVSDHAPTGAMKLVIAKDSVLKVSSFAMTMGNDMTTIPVRNFTVSPTDISWTQDMMGMTCESTAILRNGQMKGTIVCGHGSVTFTLNRK